MLFLRGEGREIHMTNNGEVRTIILDYNGVIDSGTNAAFEQIIESTLEEADIDVAEGAVSDRLKEMAGRAPRGVVLLSFLNGQADRQKVLKIYDKQMADNFVDIAPPVPHAKDVITSLAQKYKLAINSSADRHNLINVMMPAAGISEADFRGGIVTEDKLGPGHQKPEPYAIQSILMDNGIASKDAIMVGDSDTDMICSYYADVEPVPVLTGNLSLEDIKNLEFPIQYVLKDISELETTADLHFDKRKHLGWAATRFSQAHL